MDGGMERRGNDASSIMGTGRGGKELGAAVVVGGIRGRDGQRTDVKTLQWLQEDHMTLWRRRIVDTLLARKTWSLIINQRGISD